MRGKNLTVSQYVKMWEMRQKGTMPGAVGQAMDLKPTSVSQSLYLMKKAMKDPSTKISRRMQKAIRAIKEGKSHKDILVEATKDIPADAKEEKTTNIADLELAMKRFQNTMVDFIDAEINRRMQQERKEWKKLKAAHDELKLKAKHSNWVHNLQKKIGSKNE